MWAIDIRVEGSSRLIDICSFFLPQQQSGLISQLIKITAMVPVSISLGCNFDHLPLIQCLMYFMETHGKLLHWPHRTQNLEIVWESHKQAIRHGIQGSDHDYSFSLKRESSKGKNILQYLRLRLYPNMNPSTLLHPLTAQACKLMQRNPQWPSNS